jgi:hypothetical protein
MLLSPDRLSHGGARGLLRFHDTPEVPGFSVSQNMKLLNRWEIEVFFEGTPRKMGRKVGPIGNRPQA